MQQSNYCPFCRAPVGLTEQFCGNCGSFINRVDQSYTSFPPDYSNQWPQGYGQPQAAPQMPAQVPDQSPVLNRQDAFTKDPGRIHYPFVEEKHTAANRAAGVPPFIWFVIFVLVAFDVVGLATDWSFFGERVYEPQIAIEPLATKPAINPPVVPQQTVVQPPGPPLVTLPSFTGLIDKVSPSVVSVDTETVSRNKYSLRMMQGAGSGWVFDDSGIIVTNAHVIEGAKTISIETKDGKTYTPVSVKSDPTMDIAIMKINPAVKLPALKIGDAAGLKVGDWVVVVGNPLGMGISVKHGIVSRLGVGISLASESYSNLIETDAPINPGNSGGPMTNLAGEVIGIASLKLSTSGVEGMGYGISIEDALPVIQRLAR